MVYTVYSASLVYKCVQYVQNSVYLSVFMHQEGTEHVEADKVEDSEVTPTLVLAGWPHL